MARNYNNIISLELPAGVIRARLTSAHVEQPLRSDEDGQGICNNEMAALRYD